MEFIIMKHITETHIERLYSFTEQHYVEFYDLQTELVDHLANDIEAIWEQNQQLGFGEAGDQSLKKFGIFGFMEVVEQRQKAMNKRYYKYLWQELKTWFGVPKILATLALICTIYTLFSLSFNRYCLLIIYGIVIAWSFYRMVKLSRSYKQRKAVSGKKWLLEDIIFKQAGGIGFALISQVPSLYNFSDELLNSFYSILIISLVTSAFILFSFISFYLLPNKAESLLKETYPEFEAVNL